MKNNIPLFLALRTEMRAARGTIQLLKVNGFQISFNGYAIDQKRLASLAFEQCVLLDQFPARLPGGQYRKGIEVKSLMDELIRKSMIAPGENIPKSIVLLHERYSSRFLGRSYRLFFADIDEALSRAGIPSPVLSAFARTGDPNALLDANFDVLYHKLYAAYVMLREQGYARADLTSPAELTR